MSMYTNCRDRYPLLVIDADGGTNIYKNVEVIWRDNKAGLMPEGPALEALSSTLEGGGRGLWICHPETGEHWAFAAVAADVSDEAVNEAANLYLRTN